MNRAARLLLVVLLTATLALVSAGTAHAGTRAVVEVTTSFPSGSSENASGPARQEVSLFFQGDRVRVETTDLVLLYDLTSRKVCWLDPARKSYTVLPMGQFPQRGGNSSSWGEKLGRSKTEIKLKMKTTSDTKDLAGYNATRTTLQATLRASSDFVSSMRSYGVGSKGGLGGVSFPTGPGAGGPTEPEPETNSDVPIQVDAEYWLSRSAPLARTAGNPSYLWPLFALTLPQHRAVLPLLDRLTGQLDGLGLPLATQVSVRMPSASESDVPTVVVSTRVRTLQDETMDRSLFIAPGDYRQMEGY